jgi:hypothetical protein
MKKIGFFLLSVIFLVLITCDKISIKKGSVSFAASYEIIDDPSTVKVFVDDINIGILVSPVDTLSNSGQSISLTKELPIGQHSYDIQIVPLSQVGCFRNLTGTFQVYENECTKVYRDFIKGSFEDSTFKAEIVEFITYKCGCCWGWKIKVGDKYLKADKLPDVAKIGYEINTPIPVIIETGKMETYCCNNFDYYEIKSLIVK